MFQIWLLIRDDRDVRLRAVLKNASSEHFKKFPHLPRDMVGQMTALAISALNHIHANKSVFNKGYPGRPGFAIFHKMMKADFKVVHIVE